MILLAYAPMLLSPFATRVGGLVLFSAGLALAWLRARTDSIYLGILAHATFNSLALAAVLLG